MVEIKAWWFWAVYRGCQVGKLLPQIGVQSAAECLGQAGSGSSLWVENTWVMKKNDLVFPGCSAPFTRQITRSLAGAMRLKFRITKQDCRTKETEFWLFKLTRPKFLAESQISGP